MFKNLLVCAIGGLISANAMADGIPLYKCQEKNSHGRFQIIAYVQKTINRDGMFEPVTKIYQKDTVNHRTYFDVAVHHCVSQPGMDPVLYCHDPDVGENGIPFEREFTIFLDGHGDYHDEYGHQEMNCSRTGTQD